MITGAKNSAEAWVDEQQIPHWKLHRDSSEDEMPDREESGSHPDISGQESGHCVRINAAISGSPDISGQNPKDLAGSRKPPLDLIPPVANVYEAMVLKHGLEKYEPFNWREGPKINERCYAAAALRHLAAILDGQELDDDSGLPHWAHVRATAGIVLDARSLGQVQDNAVCVGTAPSTMKQFTMPQQGDELE